MLFLFACNPFRVLGIAVDTPTADVTLTYKKLLDMAAKGDTADYETHYDFDFLPPFSRSEKDLKTAYAKIASNGYRCFAFSDPIFSASLNIDDVMLNLRDISCYDCFLRCYMWLITNDRDFEEPELWIPLCQYIDKMIMSSPEQWDKYFDHRFPQDMLDSSMSALRSFYATFCDIILLPIKEMVRGSMKCRTAMEILKIAKVDVDEVFPDIDIPQANLPKRGEPAPKLKIAVKDGEEYYDVTTGKMVSFEGDEDSAIESNDFSAAASSISADAIVGEDGPDSAPIPVPDGIEIAERDMHSGTMGTRATACACTDAFRGHRVCSSIQHKADGSERYSRRDKRTYKKEKDLYSGTRGHFRLCTCKPACFCSCSAGFTACTCSNACSDSTACSADSFSTCVQPTCSTACGGSSEACG